MIIIPYLNAVFQTWLAMSFHHHASAHFLFNHIHRFPSTVGSAAPCTIQHTCSWYSLPGYFSQCFLTLSRGIYFVSLSLSLPLSLPACLPPSLCLSPSLSLPPLSLSALIADIFLFSRSLFAASTVIRLCSRFATGEAPYAMYVASKLSHLLWFLIGGPSHTFSGWLSVGLVAFPLSIGFPVRGCEHWLSDLASRN